LIFKDGEGPEESHEDGERPLHFYYNREERLKNAPKSVQDYYAGKGPVLAHGIFKTLVATPANRFMLTAVGACMLLVVFMSIFGNKPDKKQIGNTQVQLTAFSFEDAIYVSIHFDGLKAVKNGKPEKVDAVVYAIDTDTQKSQKQSLNGIYDGKEIYMRTKFPDYDIIKVQADIEIAGKKQSLITPVQRR